MPLMNIYTKKLRVLMKNDEMAENCPILPEMTFFKIFVHLTTKHTIIVKITFLG